MGLKIAPKKGERKGKGKGLSPGRLNLKIMKGVWKQEKIGGQEGKARHNAKIT